MVINTEVISARWYYTNDVSSLENVMFFFPLFSVILTQLKFELSIILASWEFQKN